MEATRAVAQDGYDAVSMRQLAKTCRLSMKTIYKFCRSKDQLIAEAHLEGMTNFRARVAAHPSPGATPEERVLRVMRSFVDALEADETRSRTMLRALYSPDAEVGETRTLVGDTFATILDAALGDTELASRDAALGTLAHVMDSVIIGWLSRRHDVAWVLRELEAAVRVILRE